MKTHRLAHFLILSWVVFCLSACLGEPPQKKHRIAFSQCCNDPWRDVMEQEMRRELAFHPEIDFEILTAGNNSETQAEQIRELVKHDIDILLVSPNEAQPLTAVIEEVYKSGIPVILIDRKTESEQYTAYVGADNYEIGKTAATYIASQLNGTGKIIELQLGMTMTPARDRSRGFRDALQKFPGMETVAQLEMNAGLEDLKSRFQEALQRHADARIVFAHNDFLAENAHNWAQEMGRVEGLFFLGIDAIPGLGKGIQAVEEGVLDASLLYPTGGSEAILLSLSMLNNLPFDKNNLLETMVITAANARILHNQMKKETSLQKSIEEQTKGLAELKGIYRNQRLFIIVLTFSLLLSLVLGSFLWKSLRTKQAVNRSLEIKNREVLEQQSKIMEMSDELHRATQAKMDFFTNISHEFRTPLTLILGFAEDLQPASKLGKEAQQSIGLIRQNAFRLLRLVNQLMDFRKIDSEKMKLKASENDLVDFVRSAMKSYEKVAQKRNIHFQLIARHEHLPVWFDANMLDKVLFNLLSNAFKFTPNGGKIHLSIAVDSVEKNIKIVVEDNGTGMTKEDATHVFEPFFQGGEGQKEGTGLGLSLSKALVELHGGTLSANTVKGKGSRFTVTLPQGKAHLREDQLIGNHPADFHAEEFFFEPEEDVPEVLTALPKTAPDQQILIIEDNADLQFFLKKKLGTDYEIIAAADGDSGLEKAFDAVPDLILCDIMLPGRDGLEITRTLKSDLRTSHIPIILLTARSMVEQQIEGTAAGADSYLTKPFNVQFLQEKIKNLLHNRRILKESFGKEVISFQNRNSLHAIDQEFVGKFIKYVELHHARQDFQVTDLSREMNLSRSQLYRKVKALLGESVGDYIQNMRLKKAEELLLEGKLTVAEIAYQVGYSSPDYFSTVFRGKYDVPPSGFRRHSQG